VPPEAKPGHSHPPSLMETFGQAQTEAMPFFHSWKTSSVLSAYVLVASGHPMWLRMIGVSGKALASPQEGRVSEYRV
jgi:hypothetical protein